MARNVQRLAGILQLKCRSASIVSKALVDDRSSHKPTLVRYPSFSINPLARDNWPRRLRYSSHSKNFV